MQVICTLEKLKTAVSQVERITSKNTSLPILSNILILVENDKMVLRSTNLQVGIEAEVQAKVGDPGSAAVPGSLFSSILSGLGKEKNVTLEAKSGVLELTTEHSSMNIKTVPPDDFPSLPQTNSEMRFGIPIKKLISGFKSVVYAASVSDIKPEIASVYVYQNGGSLVCVATDSFRLAEKRIPVTQITDFPDILIPMKNIQEIIRIFSDISGDVEVVVDDNQITFVSPYVYCTSRLVDGVFPNYQQIIPTTNTTEITVLKSDVQEALKMMTIFSDKFHQVTILVNPGEKLLSFAAQNFAVGENTTSLESAITGEEVEMKINYKYLQDVFQSIGVDSLQIQFNGGNKPMVVRGVSDDSFTYLIMPMNR